MRTEELNYCFGCMQQLAPGESRCPHCGYDNTVPQNSKNLLPEGTILNGKYLVGKTIGRGGFGVTYLGFELFLHVRVAIKEYFPNGLSSRQADSRQVRVSNQETNSAAFQKGLEAFQREAETLALFDSPSIVHVREYFLENNTAYIVMNYVEGVDLAHEVANCGGRMPWQRIRDLTLPLIRELDKLHQKNLIHRDIKPDNLKIVRKKGSERLVLLDFGAARSILNAEQTKTYTQVLTPGYAPFEQYQARTHLGPFTDVYALCATVYACISGMKPPAAPDRVMKEDPLTPFSALGLDVPENIEKAVFHGMAVSFKERTQSMAELYEELTAGTDDAAKAAPSKPEPVMKVPESETIALTRQMPEKEPVRSAAAQKTPQKKGMTVLWIACFAAAAFLLAYFLFVRSGNNPEPAAEPLPVETLQTVTDNPALMSPVPSETAEDEVFPSPAVTKTAAANAFPGPEITETTEAILPPSAEILQPTEPVMPAFDLLTVRTGDTLSFGRYEQDETAGADPIEWQVLTVENGRALLISRYGLESKAYNENTEKPEETGFNLNSWKTSTLRNWLNDEFYYIAFDQEERTQIQAVMNGNEGTQHDVDYDTQDRIFLLSGDEVELYLKSTRSRLCEASYHAKENGAYVSRNNERSRWWLRAGSENIKSWNFGADISGKQVVISYDGEFNYDGVLVNNTGIVVRPALWLNLSGEISGIDPAEAPVFETVPTDLPARELTPTWVPTLVPTLTDTPVPTSEPEEVKEGGTVTFGRYEQDEASGADPIEWLVLAVESDRALLISRYGLDAKAYHRSFTAVTWEESDLRTWLNGEFYSSAFAGEEQSRILEVSNRNPDNEAFETKGGNQTQDKLFLLSSGEAEQYLTERKALQCKPTFIAVQNGAYENKSSGNSMWWLRSPGILADNAAIIDGFGDLYVSGAHVDSAVCMVRPAFWLKL